MSVSDDFFTEHLAASRTMTILRGFDPDRTVELCRRSAELGLGLVEVPVQDAAAYPSLAAAIAWGREVGTPIGAGTVTTVEALKTVVELGAAFTVAPGFDTEVAAAGERLGVPHLPGVATATEVQRTLAAGFRWQKAFPASLLGPDWLRAMRGPFPSVAFVVTGGVDTANAASFLEAGAAAVSFGSSFATAEPAALRALLAR